MRPRQILARRFYLLTRRCLLRMFLLRPDDETNGVYLYCLGLALERCGMRLVYAVAMSNHHHVVLFDPDGRVVEFVEHLHKLVARAMNVARGRRDAFWAAEAPSMVYLPHVEDVLDKIVYAATNPVAAKLVEEVEDWPGVSTWQAFLSGQPIEVARPSVFFREDGRMPEKVTLQIALPEELGEAAAVRATVAAMVSDRVAALAAERAAAGRTVLGAAAVCAQPWTATPATVEPRRSIDPRVATRTSWARRLVIAMDRAFQAAYRVARKAFLAGEPALFPAGTYWLRRNARVTVATADPMPVFCVNGPAPIPIG
jgi:putative transposase